MTIMLDDRSHCGRRSCLPRARRGCCFATRSFGFSLLRWDEMAIFTLEGRNGWTGGCKEVPMATFVVLANFTDQASMRSRRQINRAEAFKEMAKKIGVGVKDTYWTLGSHDVVAIARPPMTRAHQRWR